jgi:hypothetical protein
MGIFAYMRANVWLGTAIIAFVITTALAFIGKKNQPDNKHTEVVLRNIGHQLLLSANDASSRVLPIKQVNHKTYQISFQSEVRVVADSLINIVQRTFQKNALAADYIIHLKDCTQKQTVLAFELNSQTGDLTPCRGRTLATGCYLIEIQLVQANTFNMHWLWLLTLPLVLAALFMQWKQRKHGTKDAPPVATAEAGAYIAVGRFQFFAGGNLLKVGDKTTILSEKEAKALKIFLQNINQVVERESLMKEIWENEGTVVISRNVDVLVSKLRKKLSDDEALKILTIPGRGYKLVMD